MISFIGFLRTYIPPEKIKNWMANKHKLVSHIAASLFGALAPFCSCSGIPIFLGFLKSGIPLGVALSFLITSPLINEYLVILMLGFFGIKITLIYIISGLISGIFIGMLLDKLNMDHLIVLKNNIKSMKLNIIKMLKVGMCLFFNTVVIYINEKNRRTEMVILKVEKSNVFCKVNLNKIPEIIKTTAFVFIISFDRK